MSGAVGTVQLAGLAVLSFALFTAIACALSYPLVQRRLGDVKPSIRARIVFVLTTAPVVLGIALTAICFLPSLLGALEVASDHCLSHDDHHTHFCFVHHPASAGSALGWILLTGTAAWATSAALRQLHGLLVARRLLKSVSSISHPTAGDVRIVNSRRPLSFTAGVLRSEVYVSSGLLHALPNDVLAIVFEHEWAHVRRRDGLRKTIARLFAIAHFPGMRARLLGDLELASEQACDEEAAGRTGDRVRVAEAIVAVARMAEDAPSEIRGVSSAFGASHVVERVQALLDAPRAAAAGRWSQWALAGAAIAAFALAEPLHHATETLLGIVAR